MGKPHETQASNQKCRALSARGKARMHSGRTGRGRETLLRAMGTSLGIRTPIPPLCRSEARRRQHAVYRQERDQLHRGNGRLLEEHSRQTSKRALKTIKTVLPCPKRCGCSFRAGGRFYAAGPLSQPDSSLPVRFLDFADSLVSCCTVARCTTASSGEPLSWTFSTTLICRSRSSRSSS